MKFFVTCAKALEPLLAAELRTPHINARHIHETTAGALCDGTLATAYRIVMWSRVANRVLLPLKRVRAESADELYAGARSIPWNDHVTPRNTIAVDCNDHYVYALKVKDALVDCIRDVHQVRPDVDPQRPDVRISVYRKDGWATIALDLAGDSLHMRGYRADGGAAPLKENLAAALLMDCDWYAGTRDRYGALLDPMCGSGTLPIEAALMAYDVAPGLLRPRVGFTQWRNHDAQLWGAVQAEAEDIKSRQLGASSSSSSSSSDASPVILGCDIDEAAVGLAQANVARAGLAGKVRIEKRDVASATKELVGGADHGLLIVNPPYGARLGSHPDAPAPQSSRMSHSNSSSNSGHSSSSSSSSGLEALYKGIGDTMKQQFRGWHGAVFTCNLELAKSVGLRTARRSTFYNGALEGRLLHYKLY